MTLKVHALFCDLPQLREAEDLKSAGIGQDRAIPRHEAMQSAEMLDDLHSRPNEQVIGVPKNDLRLELPQFVRPDCLDRPLGAHWHKNRRLDHPVRSHQSSATGTGDLI